jgi:hypothetical protein
VLPEQTVLGVAQRMRSFGVRRPPETSWRCRSWAGYIISSSGMGFGRHGPLSEVLH